MLLRSRTEPDVNLPPRSPLHVAMVSALLFGTAIADAETFTVTSTADSGSGSLREAVARTNQNPGPDTITFAAGLGPITLTSGELVIRDQELTIRGPGGLQVVSAGGNSRVLSMLPLEGEPSNSSKLVLENLHLRDGRTSGSDPSNTSGCGAEFNNGGAVCVEGRVKLHNSIVSNSSTVGDNAQGGGVSAIGIVLKNSVISRNQTYGENSRGGGFEVFPFAAVVEKSVISGNATHGNSAWGGGFSARGTTSVTRPEFSNQIINSIIRDNVTHGRSFGAGFAANETRIYATTISNNEIKADVTGGAGANLSGDSIIRGSTITGNISNGELNEATAGVAVFQADLAVFNSTITGNLASEGVGGIGISDYQTLELHSSVLSANVGTKGNFGAGSEFAQGYLYLEADTSLFGDDAAEVTSNSGNNVFTNEPALGELADNGCAVMAGATGARECVRTHLLLPDSPALDAGSNPRGLVNDQRGPGFARERGDAADIGSVETGGLAASPARLDFGVEEIGVESAPRRVTVVNTGFVPREVTSLGTIREPFLRKGGTCQAPPFGLEPGDSCTIEIAFNPSAIANPASAELQVVDDPTSSPAAIVTLTGDVGATNTIVVDSSADDGRGSLRDAVTRANARPGTDRIVFARGLSEIVLDSGQINVTDSLVLRGPEANQRISANQGSRILAVTDEEAKLFLQHITLADGFTAAAGAFPPSCQSEDGRGGALCSLGEVTMLHSVIRDSATTGESATGGGAFLSGVNILRNSVVTSNATRGDNAQGGGVYVEPPITDNNGAGASLVAHDTIISNNLTEGLISAGAGAFTNGFATLYNTVVTANRATGRFGNGAGLYARGALVDRSSITDNHASGLSPTAGGIGVSNDAIIQNSVISGNSSTLVGGGIYAFDSGLEVINSTITENSAPEGGGVGLSNEFEISSNRIQVTDSVISANTGDTGPNLLVNRSGLGTMELGMAYSIFGDSEALISAENIGNRFTDSPMLQPLADNGCAVPAGTGPDTACVMGHAVLAGSPVIDAASNRRRFAWDHRGSGHVRVAGDAPDIGAFEGSGLSASPVESDFGFVPAGAFSSSSAVTLRNSSPVAVQVNQIDPVQPPFELVADGCPATPFMLQPGESCRRDYRFAPVDASSASQQLAVQADGMPMATVRLFGNRPRSERLVVSKAGNDGTGTLREAVRVANMLPGGDTIQIDSGLAPIELTSGQVSVFDALEIRGPDVQQIVTAGRRSRILAVPRASTDLVLSGLVLQQGQTTAPGFLSGAPTTTTDAHCTPISGSGGALCARGGVVLQSVQLLDNRTEGNHARGGGAFAAESFVMQGSTVSRNSTSGRFADGGGLFAINSVDASNSVIEDNTTDGYAAGGGGFRTFGHAAISNSTISRNSQTFAPPLPFAPLCGLTRGCFAPGGGFSAESASVTNSIVTGNSTYDERSPGGGFYSRRDVSVLSSTISGNKTNGFSAGGGGFTAGSLIIEDSIVRDNSAKDGSSGGGFRAFSLTMRNSTVSGNMAFRNGGGFSVARDSEIRDSTISGNSASSRGGGAHIFDNRGSRTVIVNSTFSGNQNERNGGGLYVQEGELEVRNSTIVSNTAEVGGGIQFAYSYDEDFEVNLISSIVSGNSATCLESANNFGSLSEDDECLRGEPYERTNITLNSEYSIFGDPADEIDGVSNSNIFTDNPGLGLLESNFCARPAGMTGSAQCVPTHLPGPASPARDAGSNPSVLAADQRGPGFSRTVGAQTDIGAIETGNGLVLTPDPLEFTTTRIGESSPETTLRLNNFSTFSLLIEGLSGLALPFERDGGDCGAFPFSLPPDSSCDLAFRFIPEDTDNFAQTVQVDGDFPAGTDRQFQLTGTAVAAEFESSPATVDFGSVPVGFASEVRLIDLRNAGSLDLEVTSVAVSDSRFQRVSADCGGVPFAIGPGESCQLAYVFLPSQAGPASAMVEILSNADIGGQAEVRLTGQADSLLALLIMPDILRFGEWPLGQTSTLQMVIVENVGLAMVELGPVAIDGLAPGDFLVTTDTCSSVSLAVDDFCGIDVAFQPTISGVRTAELTVNSSAGGGSNKVALEGTNDVVFFDDFEAGENR